VREGLRAGAKGTLSNLTIFLANYSEQFIYAGLFLILLLCGLGLPIPEELTLLTSGFFVHLGIARFYPILAVAFIGVLIGDLIIYSIGRKWGHGIITHQHLHKVFTESRLERVRQFFRDHGSKTIFVARFISGFRVGAFLAAGTMGVKLAQFLFLDFLAALIMVPLMIALGFYFGASIGWISAVATRIDLLLKVLTGLAAAAAIIYYLWKRKTPLDDN
jgi:membrane protein DedA with SNARE-associated domain